MPLELTGSITNLQRFAVHDGPGIRTLVFMRGCPLRCRWCANPETQAAKPVLSYNTARCTACGACAAACPNKAIVIKPNGRPLTIRRKCTACGECVPVCVAEARKIAGRDVIVKGLLEEIMRDSVFFRNSGGGLTVGGGEPCLQAEFVAGLLQTAREEYALHTAIETCGFSSLVNLKNILRYTDLVYYDIKILDDARHRLYTGVSNSLILRNLKGIAEESPGIIIRIPVMPGINDAAADIKAIARFVKSLGKNVVGVELLPYHAFGAAKYAQLGRRYLLKKLEPPSEEHLARLKYIVASYGLDIKAGG